MRMLRLARLALAALCATGLGLMAMPAAAADMPAHAPFVPASRALLEKCVTTARTVGYPVPCPTRVLPDLLAFGGCGIDIIGPAKRCSNTPFLWRDWVIGSSTTADAHLVLTA